MPVYSTEVYHRSVLHKYVSTETFTRHEFKEAPSTVADSFARLLIVAFAISSRDQNTSMGHNRSLRWFLLPTVML